MLKQLYDRLVYALIGFAFGAGVGLVLGLLLNWYSTRLVASSDPAGVVDWVIPVGALFALIGFVLRDRVGDVAGESFAQLYDFEAGRSSGVEVPGWLAAVVLFAVVAAVWYFTRNQVP